MSSIQSYRMKMQRTRAEAAKNPTVIKVDNERYLTSGEIALAKLIYKDSINYGKVRIINGGFLGIPNSSGFAMVPFGNIHFPKEDYEKIKDFSKLTAKVKPSHQIWFIHEMAHVWQHTLGLNVALRGIEIGMRGGYYITKAYDYDLICDDQYREFNQFNFEQQADIISHYFDAFYLPEEGHNAPKQRSKNEKQKFALKKVLAGFLQNPKNKDLVSKNYGKLYYGKDPLQY